MVQSEFMLNVGKFGHLIGYKVRIFFPKNHAEKEAGRLVSELFFFFEKALCKIKATGQDFKFNIFWYYSTWTYNKTNFIKFHAVDPEIYSILILSKRFWD